MKDSCGINYMSEVLEKPKKCLSENDRHIDNRRLEFNIIPDAKIDRVNLKDCGSLPTTEEGDSSCTTFLTTASRSFSSCAGSPPSRRSICDDLDEVCNKENHNRIDVTNPDLSVGFHSSGGPILESLCNTNNFPCSISKSATTNGEQLCNNESENSNLSWISRSFCGMHSSSALENIDDESIGTSFHSAVCMPSYSFKENSYTDNRTRDDRKTSKLKEKPSTCLVCLKDMHACDCLDNVVECIYTEMPTKNSARRRKNGQIRTAKYYNTEIAIGKFLDANGIWCNSWPEWYPEEDEENLVIDSKGSAPALEKRARDLNTRRRRLERLQINLTPFSFLEEELNEGAINMERYKQGKWTRSLSDVSPKSVLVPSTAINKSVSQMNFHWDKMNCGEEQIANEMNSLSLIRTIEEEDKCYDSDPSEMLCRQKHSPKRKLRKGLKKFATDSRSDLAKRELDLGTFFGKMHGLMNSRKTLVWHGNEDNTQVAVKAWIEPGSQLQSVLIQPKFMWQQTLGNNKRTNERRVLNTRIFHSVDLLDITKIVATEAIDRTKYPFAKCSCSFIVQSFAKEMVFEAVCESERDDIVDGLKMMVARLGSKILVGDGQVLNEFFTPIGASVPGNIPTFASEGNFATAVVEN